MKDLPVLALIYDFDRTLSPKDMQEYAFIPGLGMDAKDFWAECDAAVQKHNMDHILAYMLLMIEKSKGKQLITHGRLRSHGKSVELFPGVKSWFRRVNTYANKRGLNPEHYIISSGVKEIIEGTSIARKFKEIYAASFCYDENGVPFWPAMAVNYTNKTQFLFRINKGVSEVTENKGINEYMPEDSRRVPFRNMIYIGDGLTDVPCMKLTRQNGGHSIAVYSNDKSDADKMLLHGRVDYAAPADYRMGREMEQVVFEIIDHLSAENKTIRRHTAHMDSAEKSVSAD